MATINWKKGTDLKVTDNFNLKELECKCKYSTCIDQKINFKHILLLQELRDKIEVPINITSAYRCEKHNKDVGGSPRSQHKEGNATDIQTGLSIEELDKLTEHFKGKGVYNSFIHLDSREGSKARWYNR